MRIPEWLRTSRGSLLLGLLIAAPLLLLVIGFQDAVSRNFGRPRVLRETVQTVNGIRDEHFLLRQQAWPAIWEPAMGYGFRYVQVRSGGIFVWAVSESVFIQEGGDKPIVSRVECTSSGYRSGTLDLLQDLKCTCRGAEDCTVEDLQYLVRIRTDMGVARSHSHVPLFTRRMRRMPD
ncbi:MAG: hypothetical protein IT406_03950 [Candidatus Yanofskybacteria bacterium]|nr:hypothetical protein [Candidatus Yanofskybacteria bacterium]